MPDSPTTIKPATQPPTPLVPKKPRRRKNYQKQLELLTQFCAVSVTVLESLKLDGEYVKGQIAAFKAVQAEAEK